MISYLLMRLVIRAGCAGVPRDGAKDAELLVLRHENAVLRQHVSRVRYEPADRAWFAALAPFIPRRQWAGIFPVTPATLLAWHRKLIAKKYDTSTRADPAGRRQSGVLPGQLSAWPGRTRCGATGGSTAS